MKIVIERTALLKALGHVQNIVERRTTIPVLGNVMMVVGNDQVTFTTSDLDSEVSEQMQAQGEKSGQLTAPALMLYDIVRKLPEGAEVVMELGVDERLEISAGRACFTLPILPVDEFPKMTEEGFTHQFNLSSSALRRLIDKTRFAISLEDTRHYLNGIFIHAHEQSLRAVATDGHRLALCEMALPQGAENFSGIIVPRKTVAEIRRLIDAYDDEITLFISNAKIRFQFGSTVMTSKLIEGNFPEYKRVIPTDNDKQLVVDNKVFAQAVDRVATIATEKSRAIKLTLDKDNVSLLVAHQTYGNGREDLMATYAAPAMEIGFNASYLLDVCQQIEGETACFLLNESGGPAIIKDSQDEACLFVLMPLRV